MRKTGKTEFLNEKDLEEALGMNFNLHLNSILNYNHSQRIGITIRKMFSSFFIKSTQIGTLTVTGTHTREIVTD